MSFIIENFNNGIRLAYKKALNTRISHIGITFNTGSRDENKNQIGLAHILEHMLFKGTKKHNWNYILNSIEMVGGEMNAFTTKEKTCIYASLICDKTQLAIELLADISLNSVFPEIELEKEKKVIVDEIDMYADNPEEMIVDEFYENIFNNHSLGTNILGNKSNIVKYTRNDVVNFATKLFNYGQMVISYCGPIEIEEIKKLCKKYFENHKFEKNVLQRTKPNEIKTFNILKKTQNHQCHIIIGKKAYDMFDKKRTALMFLANILGGPALNSILNITLREKYGITYGVEAAYNYFSDTGLFYIQWTSDIVNLEKSIKIVKSELLKIISKPITEKQFEQYKTQFKGQLIMAEESNQGLMIMMGRSLLDFNDIETLDKVLSEIDEINTQTLQNIAIEILNPDNMSMLVYKPE
ncbi:MAG: insulinase family protein [Bacteroidetes bacterium]|nr:insulinase family protein [Bacteroidota bacterium]